MFNNNYSHRNCLVDSHLIKLLSYCRRKTHTWYGTVAGVLSIWSPTYFLSGTKELNQTGWWKLTNNSPPTLDISENYCLFIQLLNSSLIHFKTFDGCV